MLSEWIKKVKTAFSRGVFPHELSFIIDNPIRSLLLSPSQLASRLPLRNAARVLEVGAGSGFYSAAVARRIPHGHLELLDLQPEMLDKARRNLAIKELNNVGYTLADAATLPFEKNSFDVIFLVTVFGEIAERQAFLQEARRVLKFGGVLSISEHLPDPDFSSFGKVKTLVEREGFVFSVQYGAAWNYTANFSKV